MKKCKDCGIEKDFEEFNKNSHMKSGRINKCKNCCCEYKKKHNKQNRELNAINNKIWRNSKEGKISILVRKLRYPNATKSRAFYHAHKQKLTIPDGCERCGDTHEKLEAHHCDYNKPMEVLFLCTWCHNAWHKVKTPLNRVSGIFTVVEKGTNLIPKQMEERYTGRISSRIAKGVFHVLGGDHRK